MGGKGGKEFCENNDISTIIFEEADQTRVRGNNQSDDSDGLMIVLLLSYIEWQIAFKSKSEV